MIDGIPTRQQSRNEARLIAKAEAKVKARMHKDPIVQMAYNMGYNAGSDHAVRYTIKDCYAAALLAMKKLGNYGHNGGMKLMAEMDDIIAYRITTEELIDRVYEEFGIRINFYEPFNRIEEVEQDGRTADD
jgi:hypothetical protein